MSEKNINYSARDYNTIKSELIALSKQYYPELADSFNDSSVGSWIIDLVAAVGDDLNYYIDRCYNEQNANSATMKSSVMNLARMNGLKVPGPKAAMCEVELSVVLPKTNDGNMSQPNWKYAPLIKEGAVVSNGSVNFEILEDVNFAEQFNSDAVSNRRFVPMKNSQGALTGYRVYKTVLASAGRSRVYKKLLTQQEIKPFMEVILPFQNVMAIEGILFKETSDLSINPERFEFHVNAEKFRIDGQTMTTYRYFEVNALTDQYIFGDEVETPGELQLLKDPYKYINPSTTVDGTADNMAYQYYYGAWIPVLQKYITEYTDNGYLKIIFGSGTNVQTTVDTTTPYADYQLTKIANNDLTGVLPKSGWIMYILYRDGGGQTANLAAGALNTLSAAEWVFPSDLDSDNRTKQQIKNSIRATNISNAIAGVNSPSVNEIKYMTKYNISAQERCVTLKDYELRVKMMPAKYGAPYRCRAIEDNNKIMLYMLGMTSDGKLTDTLPSPMVDNISNYLSQFKMLGDYLEIRSGNIYNIQTEVSIFIDKAYNKQSVVKSVISIVEDFFDVDNLALGDDLFIGDLEKQISAIDGVANLIDLKLYTVFGNEYKSQAPVPLVDGTLVNFNGSSKAQIDLVSMNKVLTCDAQGMYEIKNKRSDIMVKVSTI